MLISVVHIFACRPTHEQETHSVVTIPVVGLNDKQSESGVVVQD